jgi:hypothetical protein
MASLRRRRGPSSHGPAAARLLRRAEGGIRAKSHLVTTLGVHWTLATPLRTEELLAAMHGVLLDQDLQRESSVYRYAQPRQFWCSAREE